VPAVLGGCRSLARARLAALEGAVPEAVDDGFVDGIALLRTAPSPFHLAHGLLDHASYLGETGRDASAELDEAVLIAERLSAASVQRRAAALGVPIAVGG